MNILVCVKQIPETGTGELSSRTRRVVRGEGRQVINPFDLYAMEAAASVRDGNPETRIIAVTMGTAGALSILRDCIALGAETGYLICDERLAGSDVRGTAQALAAAVPVIEEREGLHFDAVFTGAKTTDGATSMLGPELAQYMGAAQVTYALRCQEREDGLYVEKEDDSGNRIYRTPYPCLVTYTKASFMTRLPLIARILDAQQMELPVLTADDLPGLDPGVIGEAGAAAEVTDVEYRKLKKESQIIEDADVARGTVTLTQMLSAAQII